MRHRHWIGPWSNFPGEYTPQCIFDQCPLDWPNPRSKSAAARWPLFLHACSAAIEQKEQVLAPLTPAGGRHMGAACGAGIGRCTTCTRLCVQRTSCTCDAGGQTMAAIAESESNSPRPGRTCQHQRSSAHRLHLHLFPFPFPFLSRPRIA